MDTEEPTTQTEDESLQGESNDDGLVDIHEASIDDLDAALKEAQSKEVQEEPEDPQTTHENLEEGKKPIVAPQGAEPAKPAYTQEEIQGILAENERYKNQGNQKELFIQHRGNELGQLRTQYAGLRQQLSDVRAKLMEGLEDRFAENPVQAINDRDRIKEIDEKLSGLDSQEERAARIVESQTFFLRHVNTEKVSIDDVAEVLKADGIHEGYISQFKSNPWEWTTPEALVQMGKRAEDRKEMVKAFEDRQVLAKHVLYLNEELKKAKGKSGQFVQQLQKNLNETPQVTAKSSVSPKANRDIDPTRMSMAELDAALAKAMN